MLDKGFSGTSLTDLAKRAGMSVSHFLYYFPDKETVLAELARRFEVVIIDTPSRQTGRNDCGARARARGGGDARANGRRSVADVGARNARDLEDRLCERGPPLPGQRAVHAVDRLGRRHVDARDVRVRTSSPTITATRTRGRLPLTTCTSKPSRR